MTKILLLPDAESEERLRNYISDNALLDSPGRLHSTLFYTEEFPLLYREGLREYIEGNLPVLVNPDECVLDLFGGGNILVVRYGNSLVFQINKELVKKGLRQMIVEWPNLNESDAEVLRKHASRRRTSLVYDFHPHITLSKRFDGRKLEEISVLDFPIVFDKMLWEQQ